VAVVEKDPSIGGKMIRLSKVFPTLDCSSCITTPKMAAAAHHPNITLFTYCQLASLERRGDDLVAAIQQKPRYVDADLCIGCRQCEYQCPVLAPDAEQGGFAARKAIYIQYCSLNYVNNQLEIDLGHGFRAATAQGEIAHFAFDPSWLAPITAG
jgi:heterodisulfide reductase subunit A2